MTTRRIVSLLLLALGVAASLGAPRTANAAPLDNAALAKIKESIAVHYLATDFIKAEAILKGTIKACGERCSPEVIAKAWMYIGIVRGAGNHDLKGAAKAFEEALKVDAFVKLDHDLATRQLKQVFEDVGGDSSVPADPILGKKKAKKKSKKQHTAAPPSNVVGKPLVSAAMACTPIVTEVETLRPIPVSCRTSKPATKMVLYYKEYGATAWNQLNMRQSGADWTAVIPCGATAIQGNLKWYALALGPNSEAMDNFGSETQPTQVDLVPQSNVAPPSLPGRPVPNRCADASDCPEEMRGTPACPGTTKGGGAQAGGLGWGASCEESIECQEGLLCFNGTCDAAPSCESDDDCLQGYCSDSVCTIERDDDAADSAEGPRSIFSLQFGADLSLLTGEGICNPHPANHSNWECFLGSQPYATPARDPAGVNADPSLSGSFGSSVVPGTLRALVAYEYLLTENLGVEAQVGMAFIKAPTARTPDMIHAALRGKYWFTGTAVGFRPFISLGGGLGEVNARKTVSTLEWYEPTPDELQARIQAMYPDPADQQAALQAALDAGYGEGRGQGYDFVCQGLVDTNCLITPVNAWIRLGSSFVSGSLGAMLNLGSVGITAEAQAKFMLPVSAIVIQPTLGMAFGF